MREKKCTLAPPNLLSRHTRTPLRYPEDGGGLFLRNFETNLLSHTVKCPTILSYDILCTDVWDIYFKTIGLPF